MSRWQYFPQFNLPEWFLAGVQAYQFEYADYIAQLLWQRGVQDLKSLEEFLDDKAYSPTSGFTAFGRQIDLAIQRLQQAWENQEKVTIWGDFDADGVTATSVLWEGLQPFFPFPKQLSYYIPNRLSESHGLNEQGLKQLADAGVTLVITCDTGSTNLAEIEIAKKLGIDIIITDHHTLPAEEPAAIALLNPKYLIESHPLYSLSGVAVAYKLIECLYESFPDIPSQPVEELLDLVAIGLVADLVELRGDCRYLAQQGIKKLAQQRENPTRPGVAELLYLCKKTGDRPMDISFGIGPRINAISRIQGDASFAVELLTSREEKTCQKLAQKTEAANTRRKELQKEIEKSVKQQIEALDLSTTGVIVLADAQWHAGVLGLVAGQIAQEYARPTVLLSLDESSTEGVTFARGSARSVQQIDLYELLRSQRHLLDRFGGHPFAAGLSLKAENLPLFREAINQQFRQKYGAIAQEPILNIDLTVTVEELGKELFQALKKLEPYGMGNPIPRLLIKNCWFTNVWNKNIQDYQGKTVRYIRTTFNICDQTQPEGFPGMWWGHYKEELPEDELFDAVVELDFNTYKTPRYEVRLVEVKPHHQPRNYQIIGSDQIIFLDQRFNNGHTQPESAELSLNQPIFKIEECPRSWEELKDNISSVIQHQSQENGDISAIALAYSHPEKLSPQDTWKQLLGIALYVSRIGQTLSKQQLKTKLKVSDQVLNYGLEALEKIGFKIQQQSTLNITGTLTSQELGKEAIQRFIHALQEEQFRCQYFSEVPLEVIQEKGIQAD